jgi:hypothetical protein
VESGPSVVSVEMTSGSVGVVCVVGVADGEDEVSGGSVVEEEDSSGFCLAVGERGRVGERGA